MSKNAVPPEYSSDDGATWLTLDASAPNSGSSIWNQLLRMQPYGYTSFVVDVTERWVPGPEGAPEVRILC